MTDNKEVIRGKAMKFDTFLAMNDITYFSREELDDPMHSVVYRAHMGVNNRMQPVQIFLDDSAYSMIKVLIAYQAVTQNNKPLVLDFINGLNEQLKSFKYYVDGQQNLCLDIAVVNDAEHFDPDMFYQMVSLVMMHLKEQDAKIMEAVNYLSETQKQMLQVLKDTPAEDVDKMMEHCAVSEADVQQMIVVNGFAPEEAKFRALLTRMIVVDDANAAAEAEKEK